MITRSSHQTYENITQFVGDISFDPTVWYISLAVEKETTPEVLLRMLRSQLPGALEKNGLHSLVKYQLREVIKQLHNYTRQLLADAQTLGNDVFVIMKFNSTKLSRASRNAVDSLCTFTAFSVPKVIANQLSVSNVPDLTYIFTAPTVESSDPHAADTIVITVDPEYASCYKGQSVDPSNLVWSERNIYSKPEEDRYIEVVTMTSQNQITHGTGSDKAKRTYTNGLFLFARHQMERIQRELNPQVVYVFFSQRFTSLQKELRAMVSQALLTKSIHFEIVSSDYFDDIEISILEKSRNAVDTLPEVQNNYETVTDLHEVNKLVRMGNIKTVILSTELDEVGYVTPDSKAYTYPVKNSKKVPSIRPWLIRSALNVSAQVKVSQAAQMSSNVIGIRRY